MPTHFAPAAIKFFKGLKKNNDRTWFGDRKDIFEREVKEPWLALIQEINTALADFAPDYIKPAPKALFRIYRDIRFSPNKAPYKTRLGAWWSPAALGKTSGGGFYAHVGADDVVIAAGVYMPQPDQLLAIRRHLQLHHAEMRAHLASKKLRKLLPDLDSNPLQRMPKGFAQDDPAAELLLCRQWAISATLPVDAATSPKLLTEMLSRFRAAAPMVALLNAPLVAATKSTPRKTLF
jgi:uncharacterized protein (TIGR02453 family)